MGDLITVYRGDENRPKVDIELQSDSFFGTVYIRAFEILKKIIQETNIYRESCKTYGYKPRFQGMGNNTIMFIAERGQGKTSAMQSFANALNNLKEYREWSKGIESVGFYVLDAIDPSALDKKENIIKVLLSRLFFAFNRNRIGHSAYGEGCEQFGRHEKLLKLLMDCYDNIEILKENCSRDEDEDDLEHLAQMGSSAKLKENLNDLIEVFLKFMLDDKFEQRYLIIQIDDVDLSTSDIYDICDDIYRYFSVPNVVVLMAADYSQLRYALCEKYLKQYKELQDSRSKVKIYDKCHDMATRYLEKVFPEGHRIELPVMQNMTVDDYAVLKISYLYNPLINKNDNSVYAKKIENKPESLCAHLMRRLYRKTGVILLNDKNMIHPLLPRTMRELTHFLNLLDEMPDIDFVAVCGDITAQGDHNKKERENLLNNLSRLKRHYFYDWCTNYLDEEQWDLMITIDASEPQRKVQTTLSLLEEYINKISNLEKDVHVNEASYHNMMWEIENNEVLRNLSDFRYALVIYYSLFLNEWFVKALNRVESMKALAGFVKYLVYPTKRLKDFKVNGLKVNFFDVPADKLKERLNSVWGEKQPYRGFVRASCELKVPQTTDERGTINQEIAAWENGIWDSEVVVNNLHFDYFRLLLYMLFDNHWREQAMDYVLSINEYTNDLDNNIENEGLYNEKVSEIILALKNIITNYQVQQKIQTNIEDIAVRWNLQDNEGDGLMLCYQNMGKALDDWMDGTDYKGGILPDCLGVFFEACIQKSKCLNDIILSNADNVQGFSRIYKKNIDNVVKEHQKNTKCILDILNKDDRSVDELYNTLIDWNIGWDNALPRLVGDVDVMPDNDRVKEYQAQVQKLTESYNNVVSNLKSYLKMEEEVMLERKSSDQNKDSNKRDCEKSFLCRTDELKQMRDKLINAAKNYLENMNKVKDIKNASKTRRT